MEKQRALTSTGEDQKADHFGYPIDGRRPSFHIEASDHRLANTTSLTSTSFLSLLDQIRYYRRIHARIEKEFSFPSCDFLSFLPLRGTRIPTFLAG